MSESLREAIARLADARRKAGGTKTLLADRKAQFERENRELVAQMNRETDAVAAAEIVVRTLTLEAYSATGDKKPAPGVEVKIGKEYTIDEAAAFEWAKAKDLCLIPQRLDVEAVKKFATVQPLPFVTVTDEPKPQIARDLDTALAVAAATAAATAETEPF